MDTRIMSVVAKGRKLLFAGLILTNQCIPSLQRSDLETISFLRFGMGSTPSTIYVNITGLKKSGLVISLNSSEEIAVGTTDKEVSFKAQLAAGSKYIVRIKTQPSPQTCEIAGQEGIVVGGDIRTITVNCESAKYTLGGTITGLAGFGLVLSNGSDSQSIGALGTFAFAATYEEGTAYSVGVTTQPAHPTQNCIVTGGTGTFTAANVNSLAVNCTTTAHAISVVVNGVASGTLSLTNNGADALSITTNGTHYFSTDIPSSGSYSIGITAQPSGHTCVLTGSTAGIIASSDVSVNVNCFSLLAQTPPNFSPLQPNQDIRLQFSEAVTIGSCSTSSPDLARVDGNPLTFTLATTNIPNDTLVVSPSPSQWTTGAKLASLTCVSASAFTLAAGQHTVRYTVPSAFRYVSSASGNDMMNTGYTPGDPFSSLHKAIDDLSVSPCFTTKDCVVYVEDGTYEAVNVPLSKSSVEIMDGISLFGGYTASTSFATRNTSLKQTQIINSSPVGCAASDLTTTPCMSVDIPSTVSNKTTIDGFKIVGANLASSDPTGVRINGGDPIFSNNWVVGGTGRHAAGMVVLNFGGVSLADPAAGALVLNLIQGGECIAASCNTGGIYYDNNMAGSSVPIIQANQIIGGFCSTTSCNTYGIYTAAITVSPDFSLLRGNVITGGTVSPIMAGSVSTGFYLSQSIGGVLKGNVIQGGTANTAKGIHMNASMGLKIGDLASKEGNIILAGSGVLNSYGLFLMNGASIHYNTISGGTASNSGGSAISYGISALAGFYDIEANSITGGNAVGSGASYSATYGMHFSNATSGTAIKRNRVSGGFSNNTGTSNSYVYGVYFLSGGSFVINNNFIDGGRSISATANGNSEGLTLSNNNAVTQVYHNTISSGTATSAVPSNSKSIALNLVTTVTNATDVQNNVLMVENSVGTRFCINYDSGSALTAVRGNTMFNCPILFNHTNSASAFDTLCPGGFPGVAACTANPISGVSSLNLTSNPNFVSNFGTTKNWNFTATSPCAITQMSNVIGGFNIDYSGNPRPGGNATVSGGALEYDGTCL
ncbi:hypothetical protein [Leptospira idonii]|uniref:Uncharacterized protein n=1 Tax=Leptospira idonii TaxID=1193500 RepID=A0A4R9M2A1_9LEPT|nr:hypothetical protein [Leptospira idonii]TGN19837.1 hypothetical protein EHS15_06975 [Leptospira idonii]